MLFHLYATSLTPLIKPLQTTKQLVSRYVRASPSPCPPHSAGALSFQPGSGPVTRQHFKLRLGGIRPACEIETSCVLMFIHNPKAVGVERLLLFVLNMGTTQWVHFPPRTRINCSRGLTHGRNTPMAKIVNVTDKKYIEGYRRTTLSDDDDVSVFKSLNETGIEWWIPSHAWHQKYTIVLSLPSIQMGGGGGGRRTSFKKSFDRSPQLWRRFNKSRNLLWWSFNSFFTPV